MAKAKVTIRIGGMHCAACAQTIEKALLKEKEVVAASVNLATEKAFVEYNPAEVTLERIMGVIREVGYEPVNHVDKEGEKARQIDMRIGGMSCASCAVNIEKGLRNLEGVEAANVNFAAEKATVTYDPAAVSIVDLRKIVEDLGYRVVSEEEVDRSVKEMGAARRRMTIAWLFTVPIIVWMIPEMFFGAALPDMTTFTWGMVLLAVPPIFVAGFHTYRSAAKSLMHRTANMDVLIMIGTLIAFLTGPASMVSPLLNYAGVAAMIMSFHLTGRFVEAKAKGRASQAITRLLKFEAKSARIIIDGEEKEVPIQEVKVGDVMIVRPGEKVPTDGVVVEGESAVDESMATGESMPVQKKPGNEVIGSTINQEGLIKVRATRIGKDTFISQVIKLVEECQGTKVPIQEFADKVTGYFVPAVLLIAFLIFLLWLIIPDAMMVLSKLAEPVLPWVDLSQPVLMLAISATVSTLVIACPCALGLATPTALMVGTGIGAEKGILIRKGEAIQTMKDVKAVIFDKTGTLTKGKPEVTDIISFASQNDGSKVLYFAASVEHGSEHPIGQAIVKKAAEKGIHLGNLEKFEAVKGQGVKGAVDGQKVVVGKLSLIDDKKIDSQVNSELEKLEKQAKTVMAVALNGRVLGLIAVADTLKEDAAKALRELESMKLKTVMLTGDNRRTAEVIAGQLGINDVYAEVMPNEKVEAVRQTQQKYGIVAMVGDGINDAPALAQSNVGMAIGTGTDIAIEAGDIVLVREDLTSLVTAVKLSKATFRKIRQNLFWALFYNTVAIPLAILGVLHPVIAELCMATSSVSVVTNANLLRRVNIKPSYANN
ncbi:MAG: heavy metal translocating P-type ATPase [Candidatus Bathyarchaeota archaeon]|nr:heavy metal translocating P-type ATPase [Candidatus Bathyarchaeota archaeon]